MSAFWNEALTLILFIYGLAFFSLGLALLVESGRSSELMLARTIRLLAGFGLLHGTHEWLDLLEHSLDLYYDRALPAVLIWLRLSLLVGSFLALLAFGEGLLQYEQGITRPLWRITLGALGWYFASALLVQFIYELEEAQWATAANVLARYVIGIPGAMLACLALWRQRRTFQEQGMGLFVSDLTIAAVALAIYGIGGQIFVPKSVIFPAQYINNDLFLTIFGFPVQLMRAAVAVVVAFSMIRVLRALEVENRQQIDAMRETEQRSLRELERLNQELHAANEEKAQLLDEVRRRDAMRGVLLQRITAAQEAERRRIARELHDETGQALTGLAMGLRGMSAKLSQQPEAALLTRLEGIATAALGDLRVLINDLRPPQLDDMGLVAALRWMASRCVEINGLPVRFELEGDPIPLPPEVETTLFRIAQEGLHNIVKHSQAQQACIRIAFAETLTLEIWDNGKGFDPVGALEPNTGRTAWGLLGMQERAGLIDGVLTLESELNQGTTLRLQLHPERSAVWQPES